MTTSSFAVDETKRVRAIEARLEETLMRKSAVRAVDIIIIIMVDYISRMQSMCGNRKRGVWVTCANKVDLAVLY